MQRLLQAWLNRGHTKMLLWASVVGLIAGAAAVLFRFGATILPRWIWPAHADLVLAVSESPLWMRLLIPAVGGLLAGLVLTFGRRWSGTTKGWDILEAVVLRDGVLPFRPTMVKCISSLLTVASAGAVGREGPMVLFAATVSSFTGRRFGVSTRHLRILVGCGIAAGIASAYNTPISAALFTMEIIFGSFAMEIFAPLVFSSVLATLLSRSAFGSQPVFGIPEFSMTSGWEILPYTLLGVLGGVTAALFLVCIRWASRLFRRSRLPRPIAMAAAGLALGVVIIWFPEVLGNGREAIRHLFVSEWSVPLALTLLALRLTLTSLAVGSGAVGGIFTPTLFVGAVLGDAFGTIFHQVWPTLVATPKAYALVGMGSVLAGTIHAPLTAAVMLFEMSLDYNLVLPLLLAAAASSLVARGLSQESIYTEALKRKRGAASDEAAVMTQLSVKDVMRNEQAVILPDTPLPQVLERFIAARRNHLYVVDEQGRFLGVVGLHDVNGVLRESENPALQKALDLAHSNFQTTTPDERLDRVLERFWAEETERLPVLDNRDSGRLLGTISQRDILGVYSLEVLHRRTPLMRFGSRDPSSEGPTYVELPVDHQVDDIPVPPEVVGMTMAEARFRERFGLPVLLIRRVNEFGKEIRLIPEGATKFFAQDRLIVYGPTDRLDALKGGGTSQPQMHADDTAD